MEHMYIRHTVGGRLFLDTKKHNVNYSLQFLDEKWAITIHILDRRMAEAIVDHRDELNIFVVTEGQTSQKSWYYTRYGNVKYDQENQELTIIADSKMDYSV
ncbi:hypothetical protein [Ammoniphilus sp. CFH 90114]|uniref:hypothetical protein n=1 Tax=Ammoniphilus sp. CFH 90114 TaxID=2493665 RepID=UPI00100FCACE|nr:hypothetical protein [Ammoniphilus sp. CFH 90114]RXT15408.1 hypothetical protein EIZ39_04210 [Ammoniphilus sp. CFH 90114]